MKSNWPILTEVSYFMNKLSTAVFCCCCFPDVSATSPVTMPPNKEPVSGERGGGGGVETIEIVKPDNSGLGLMICERDKQGVFVQNVVFNEPAYLDQRLKMGDRILAINGVNTTSARQDYVVQLLQV